MATTKQTKRFRGLNNVSDPLRLRIGWLTKADNINISDTGRVTRRSGYSAALAGSYTGAYSTKDYTRLFVVDGGNLKRVNRDLTTTILRAGLAAAPMHWAEVNREIFFSNGPDKGIIGADNTTRPWMLDSPSTPSVSVGAGTLPEGLYQVACTFVLPDGRETGGGEAARVQAGENSALVITSIPQVPGYKTRVYVAPANSAQFQLASQTTATSLTWSASPDSLGVNLPNPMTDAAPRAAVQPAYFAGRMYLMEYIPSSDTTVVWFSQPLGFHLFDLERNFLMVRGKGVLLAAHTAGLVIGTTTQIHGFDGQTLTLLADYGAVPGWSQVTDENNPTKPLMFWTQRGVCSAFPFTNLTAERISVAPGVRAGAAVINEQGARRYVVALQKGDSAFNQRSYP